MKHIFHCTQVRAEEMESCISQALRNDANDPTIRRIDAETHIQIYRRAVSDADNALASIEKYGYRHLNSLPTTNNMGIDSQDTTREAIKDTINTSYEKLCDVARISNIKSIIETIDSFKQQKQIQIALFAIRGRTSFITPPLPNIEIASSSDRYMQQGRGYSHRQHHLDLNELVTVTITGNKEKVLRTTSLRHVWAAIDDDIIYAFYQQFDFMMLIVMPAIIDRAQTITYAEILLRHNQLKRIVEIRDEVLREMRESIAKKFRTFETDKYYYDYAEYAREVLAAYKEINWRAAGDRVFKNFEDVRIFFIRIYFSLYVCRSVMHLWSEFARILGRLFFLFRISRLSQQY